MYKDLAKTLLMLFSSALWLLPMQAHSTHNAPETQAVLDELEANRRLIVEENMPIAAAKPAFWEVYDAYRSEISGLEAQSFTLLLEFRDHYEEITDGRANNLLVAYLDVEEQTLAVRRAYIAKFNAVISPKKTLRFYQVENKLDAIIQADISATTPLVPDAP